MVQMPWGAWWILSQVDGYEQLMASSETEYIIYALIVMSVLLFVFSGMLLFQRGFEDYEQNYLASGAQNLDSLYLSIPPEHLMYISIMLFLLLTGLGSVVSGKLLVGVFFGFPALFFPSILFLVLGHLRLSKFENQLPDALDNLKSSVQAGLSLPQSFEVLVHESRDPMRQEFRVVCQEIALGVQQSEALTNIIRRTPLDDLRIAVNSINICTEQGGDLPGMLKTASTVIRDRLELSGKLRAITSQGKMQGLIVASLPIVLIWVVGIIDPVYMKPLLTTFWGWAMIGLICIMDAMGYLWIRAIVNIEI